VFGSIFGAVLVQTTSNGLVMLDANPYLYPLVNSLTLPRRRGALRRSGRGDEDYHAKLLPGMLSWVAGVRDDGVDRHESCRPVVLRREHFTSIKRVKFDDLGRSLNRSL
jgi:hypothetical protein